MDSAIDRTSKKNILNIIKANDNVKRIGTLYSISVGYQYVVVITIYVDGNLSTVDSHEIADKLEKDIISNVKNIKEVIAHVEPY